MVRLAVTLHLSTVLHRLFELPRGGELERAQNQVLAGMWRDGPATSREGQIWTDRNRQDNSSGPVGAPLKRPKTCRFLSKRNVSDSLLA